MAKAFGGDLQRGRVIGGVVQTGWPIPFWVGSMEDAPSPLSQGQEY